MSREDKITQIELLYRNIGKKFKSELNQLFEGEITPSDFLILKFLHDTGPTKASNIAHQFVVSLSHITALCDRLVKKGLIHRTRSDEDRRWVVVGLSDEGSKKVSELSQIKKQYTFHIFKSLTDDELEQLIHIYKKLNES